jgi:hypothetical protein
MAGSCLRQLRPRIVPDLQAQSLALVQHGRASLRLRGMRVRDVPHGEGRLGDRVLLLSNESPLEGPNGARHATAKS